MGLREEEDMPTARCQSQGVQHSRLILQSCGRKTVDLQPLLSKLEERVPVVALEQLRFPIGVGAAWCAFLRPRTLDSPSTIFLQHPQVSSSVSFTSLP